MIMFRRIAFFAAMFQCCITLPAQVTLEECVALARDNYPLIRKYGLLQSLSDVSLSDIDKSWLPQISVYGQGTTQNVVPSLPDGLTRMLGQVGTDMPGLSRQQYKVGLDLSQTVWDGGVSKSRRRVERAQNAEHQAELDVQMYAVTERVENLFFAILLIDEQIKQTQVMATLLESNLRRLQAMLANGAAMQSDADMVEARYLSTVRQLTQAESAAASYRRVLELFTGRGLGGQALVRPEAPMPDAVISPDRPEMRLFDARMHTNTARESIITTTLMPRISIFAQAYYGYPGIDYFKSMTSRDPSANIVAGLRVSWSIGGLYTKRNEERRLRLSADGIASDRDVFLFNASMQMQAQNDDIRTLERMMKDDGRIVELNENVRRAAESQLQNGVIDTTALLAKITDENQARLTKAYHEIQLMQSIYKLKHTLNR